MTGNARKNAEMGASVLAQRTSFIVAAIGGAISVAALLYVTWIGCRLAASDITNIRGDEPYFASGVMNIVSGGSPYGNPSSSPYLLTGYTPTSYYLYAGAIRFFHGTMPELGDAVRTGRTISVILTLFHAALLLYLLTRHWAVRALPAVMLCSVVYATRMPWGFVMRPDPLFSVLFLANVGFISFSLDRERSRATLAMLLVAGALATVLFFTKQTGAQIPALVVVYCAFMRKWQAALFYLAGAAAAAALALVLFHFVFEPGWAAGMFLTNSSGVNSRNALWKVFGPALLRGGGIVLIAAAVPAWIHWLRSEALPRLRFLAWVTLGALGFSTLTAFSAGAAEHYYNDSILLTAVCVGAYWFCGPDRRRARENAVAICLSVYCALFLPYFLYPYASNYLRSEDRFENRAGIRAALGRLLQEHPGSKFITVDNTLANYFLGSAVVPQYEYATFFRVRNAVHTEGLQPRIDDGTVRWCLIGEKQDLAVQLGYLGLVAPGFVREGAADGFAIWSRAN